MTENELQRKNTRKNHDMTHDIRACKFQILVPGKNNQDPDYAIWHSHHYQMLWMRI